MFDYLKNIVVRLSIPIECHEPLFEAFKKISQEDLDYFLCQYEDEHVEYMSMLNNWQTINKRYKIPKCLGDLLFCLLMCRKLEEIYKRRGLSEKLFIDTMTGISYTVVECKLIKKQLGTFVAWWFDDFYRLRRFAFGRLQFELSHFGYTYKDDIYNINPYIRCINVHIPRNKKRLDEKEVDESINLALEFFRPMFDNKQIIFKCESWLLYKKTLELSSRDSNIYKFSQRFNIFKQIEGDDITELWRLFDDEIDTNNLKKLKADTSLRRRYLEYAMKGGKFGEGCGFFVK